MKQKTLTPTNSKRKFVFAIWEIETLPEDLEEFHISCGRDDDSQDDGYFIDDKNALLLIQKIANKYQVKLFAPSRGLQRYKNYWLSPNQVDGQDAKDFGMI